MLSSWTSWSQCYHVQWILKHKDILWHIVKTALLEMWLCVLSIMDIMEDYQKNLKGAWQEILDFRFFHKSFSPWPLRFYWGQIPTVNCTQPFCMSVRVFRRNFRTGCNEWTAKEHIWQYRLYWYRGVTVLLPGWVIWKYMWFVHANLPIGRLTSDRTVDLHWGEWLNSSADFNPNHNHVNAAPTQASLQTTSRPHHHATPKQNYCI